MADEDTNTPVVDGFDPTLLKKKKSKKKVEFSAESLDVPSAKDDDGDVAAAATTEDSATAAMFGDLKKKKKKKSKGEDGESTTVASGGDVEQVESSMDSMFIDLKKKKKKKSALSSEALADGGEQQQQTHGYAMETGSREGMDVDAVGEGAPSASKEDAEMITSQTLEPEGQESWVGTDRDYTYFELLARVFRTIRQRNPEFAGEKRRYTMVPPQVGRDGKKTIFANIADICRRMNRSMEHLISYIYAEYGTQGSVDGSQRLIIKGKFTQKQIETVLRKYIVEYVTCQTCRSPETVLHRENRLLFLQCSTCGSNRTVSVIKGGFRAQTEKRKLMRPQQ